MYVWGWVWPGAFEGPGASLLVRNVAECEMIMWEFSFGNSKKWEFGERSNFWNIPTYQHTNLGYELSYAY